MDVSKQDDWKNLAEHVKEKYGVLDCLVNNAGTTYPNKVDVLHYSLLHDD